MNVRIYVEGGGDQRATQTECRRGFREFFGRIVGEGPHPRVVAGGSRNQTVQCMEAWLVADRDAVAVYYGEGFNPKALPGEPDIEQVPKADVFRALERATHAAKTKGPYGKTTHGFDLLAMIDPQKVRQASQHAERLAGVLLDRLR